MNSKEAIDVLRLHNCPAWKYNESLAVLTALAEDYEKVKAEVERLKEGFQFQQGLIKAATEDALDSHARAEKAEAELVYKENAKQEVERQLEDCWIARKIAEAELARWGPVIEAAEKACLEYLQGELMDLKRLQAKSGEESILSESIPILRAALECRETKP
jgi:hypothetical protein